MPSENGWNPARVSASDCEWVRIPGAEHVSLQFLKGQPLQILRAYAADYHAYIEPLRDADSASYTPTNSVATSNHLNGTAMDLNWNSHPFRVDYAGFDGPKIARMRELLAFYNFEGLQIMFWAQDWRTPKDAMHHQLGYGTYGDPRTQRFIDQRIRPDGFSTYKRGGSTTPPAPPVSGAVDVLARATGLTVQRAGEILTGVVNGLRDSQCNNVNRIAMWLAQMGHESAGFKATEEYASGAAYEGRKDLGNTQPGDGMRFKGRSWIQVTGRANYTALSKWAHSKGIVPTPTFFVDQPTKLAEMQYAGLGPAWYWTVARADINALSDRRDLVTVTKRINGGTNGLADRQQRYDRALKLGDQLLTLTTPVTGDDELSAEAERMIRDIHRELTQQHPSRSALRKPGEGAVDTWAGMDLNTDGNVHLIASFLRAWLGHPKTLTQLRDLASSSDPLRTDDAELAQAILAAVSNKPAVAVAPPVAATYVAPAPEPQIVYMPAPEPVAPQFTGTPGQIIGAAYDAIAALDVNADLPPESKATLGALITILQAKVGTAA